MSLPVFQPIEAAAECAVGLVRYEEFAPAERSAAPPPCFLFGPLPGYLSPDLFAGYDVGAVGCYRLRETRVTWDAILLQEDKVFWSLALNHPQNHVRDVLEKNVPGWAALKVRHVVGQAAILHGPGFDVFGHWLIDFLPRLYMLRRAGLNIHSLAFLLPLNTPGYAREFLRLIGIPSGNLVFYDQKTELVAADELIVPTMLRLKDRFHPLMVQATRYWLDQFCAHAQIVPCASPSRHIFVSRGLHSSHRVMASRAEIERRAEDRGYEIVHPQQLSLPAQVQMFMSSARIIGEYGSALHSAMFAPPGTLICAVRGTSHHPGFAQSGLAERFGHHLGYVFGPTPEHAGEASFDISPAAFDHALEAMDVRHAIRK